MAQIHRYIIMVLFWLLAVNAVAVPVVSQPSVGSDTVAMPLPVDNDTAWMVGTEPSAASVDTAALPVFEPDPMRAVWMGAIIPGYGQIYNRKYWKLPIVYGGFLGCAYAIAWNGSRYVSYKNAYRDIIDNDPNTNSFLEIIPDGYTIESLGGMSQYTKTLQTKQNTFRRYRDLSIIITVGLYALTLIDAYVDAQLYNFDISPDLTMHLSPGILEYGNQDRLKAAGLQLTIHL